MTRGLKHFTQRLSQQLSKSPSLPLLSVASPAANRVPSAEQLEGYLACQRLAREAVHHVAGLMQPGWTEKHAATLVNTYLSDSGVKNFFHKAFAWFGERTRFDGITGYAQYSPTNRCLNENEIFILDVAPIYHGFTCDIGYTSALGNNEEWKTARAFLDQLRRDIPEMAGSGIAGDTLWKALDTKIKAAGYENIHQKYPFAVLGHRVHQFTGPDLPLPGSWWNFGWKSYWSLTSRGLFGQLLSPNFQGDMTGLWAIEPHIGGKDFGAKFEEILIVENGQARWLDPQGVL